MKNSFISKALVYLSILLLVCDPIFVHSLSLAKGVITAVVILTFASLFYVYRASSKKEFTDGKAWSIVVIDILVLFFSAALLFVTFWSATPGPM